MCRAQAHALCARKSELDALDVRLICILKEALPDQVEQFRAKYWVEPAEVFVDEGLGFFSALGGGRPKSKSIIALASSAVRTNYSRALTGLFAPMSLVCVHAVADRMQLQATLHI